MENLEKFISKNRGAFDDKTPPDRVWQKVEAQLQPKAKRFVLWRGIKVAAAVLLLLTAGALIGISFTNYQQSGQLAEASLTDEFLEVERYYQQQVNQKVNQLVSMKNYDQSIDEDLDQLDVSIKELKEEIADAPKGSEAEMINTMINNYKTKVELLERVLEHMQGDSHNKTNKNKENESTNI